MRRIAAVLIVAFIATVAASQPVVTPPAFRPLVGVLPTYNDANWNWQNAGLLSIGGIPTRNTQCGSTVNPTGVKNPPQGTDDATTINAAITACTAGDVVQLASGTFYISSQEFILIGNGVTLRGSGSCNNGSTPYCATVIDVADGLVSWTGGNCGNGPIAAAGSWTTSNNTITMSVNNPGIIASGWTVYDQTTSGGTIGFRSVGTVSSWSTASTTLALTANASIASVGSSDNLVFITPCTSNSAVNVQPSAASNVFDFGWNGSLGNCSVIHQAIGCGTQLDADAAQGQTTVRVHSTTGFSVGGWVLIDEASGATWQNDPVGPNLYGQVWAAPDWLSSSGSPATGRVQWFKFGNGSGDMGTGQYPYNSPGTIQSMYDRATSEIHLIKSIGAGPCPGVNCTITFDDPLTIAYRQSGNTAFTGTISNGSGGAGTTLTTTGDNCTTTVAQIIGDTTATVADGTYVTAVNSCSAGVGNYTVSISQHVASETMIGGAHQAHIYYSAHASGFPMAFLANAGIENVTIRRAVDGGVNFQFCAYCWIKNVELIGWSGGAVNFSYTVRDQMDTVYSNICGNSTNNGAEYPVGLQDSSTEIYVVNSIIRQCGKGMVGKAAAAAVVAYNYVDASMYDSFSGIGDYWLDMGVNASHWTGTHHFLFEGNWGNNLDNDDTHGNTVYHTYFRNWGTGLRTAFTDPSVPGTVNDATGAGFACGTTGGASCFSNPPGVLRVIGPMMHNYWLAYVGNVLGTSGQTTTGNGWNYSGDFSSTKHIWMPGWNSDASNTTKSDPNLTGATGDFQFKHGNYDYVNGSISDWTAGYSHALPNSFYLSRVPSFFGAGASCTYTWPWVTPETGTQLHSNSCSSSGLPAKARYDAGTPFVQP